MGAVVVIVVATKALAPLERRLSSGSPAPDKNMKEYFTLTGNGDKPFTI
jgi:hypothetical protein